MCDQRAFGPGPDVIVVFEGQPEPGWLLPGARGYPITIIETVPIGSWHGPFAEAEQIRALNALEEGRVVFLPNLAFVPDERCRELLSDRLADRKTKNISYAPATGRLKGSAAADRELPLLHGLMNAFSAAATGLLNDLLPHYAGGLECGRASYRPAEIEGREYSLLKDDKLLHVDAFPSTPTRGRRILRFFTNINPAGKPRTWHVGEPFEAFAARFLPQMRRPFAPALWALAAIGATRGRRTPYDQIMLGLHDSGKRDAVFQAISPHEEFAFRAGSSWLCFTDQVVHAALSGQYALEQTFYLDVSAMADPARSPLRILERMSRRKLC